MSNSGTNDCLNKSDLNCDGTVESWESSNDIPRIVFGTFSMMMIMQALYIVIGNNWHINYWFKGAFYTWYSAAGTFNLIFSALTAFPLFLLWIASYSMNLAVIDAFYAFAYVNTWYIASFYWLIWMMYVIHTIVRNLGTLSPDTTKDHSTTVSMVHLVLGFTALVLQTVLADRFNFWYVKIQYHGGRSVNEAKNNVWSYPASLGSTARSWYNYVDTKRDAQTPIEKAKKEKQAAEA